MYQKWQKKNNDINVIKLMSYYFNNFILIYIYILNYCFYNKDN